MTTQSISSDISFGVCLWLEDFFFFKMNMYLYFVNSLFYLWNFNLERYFLSINTRHESSTTCLFQLQSGNELVQISRESKLKTFHQICILWRMIMASTYHLHPRGEGLWWAPLPRLIHSLYSGWLQVGAKCWWNVACVKCFSGTGGNL